MKRKNIVRLVENLTNLKYKSISDCLDRMVFTDKPYNRKNMKPLKSEWHFIYVENLEVKSIITLKKQLDTLELIPITKTVINLEELEGRREFAKLLLSIK